MSFRNPWSDLSVGVSLLRWGADSQEAPGGSGWGLVPRKPGHMVLGLGLGASEVSTRGEGLEVGFHPTASDLINCVCIMKIPVTPADTQAWGASWLVAAPTCPEGYTLGLPGRGLGSSVLPPRPPCVGLIIAYPL